MGPFRLVHHNELSGAIAANTPTKISLTRAGHGVWITNQDAAATLEVSFDGGRNFFGVRPQTMWYADNVLFHFLFVRTSQLNHVFFVMTKEG